MRTSSTRFESLSYLILLDYSTTSSLSPPSLNLSRFILTMRLLSERTHWQCNRVTVRGGWWEGEGYNGPLWTQTQLVHPWAQWVRVKQSWQERSSVEMHWRFLNATQNFHWLNRSLSKCFTSASAPTVCVCEHAPSFRACQEKSQRFGALLSLVLLTSVLSIFPFSHSV